MAKRQITTTEAFVLRQSLHVATLDAMMSSRRWEPGDLVFQGGTSLHLAHGSPRFSEDLDFLVNSTLKLDLIGSAMQSRLESAAWLPEDVRLTVGKARDGRNPHAFIVSIGGPDVIGSVRVKVEMWQTRKEAISSMKVVVAPVRLSHGMMSGVQAFVPTADLPEIYADKVFALVARPYLKPRDVFDLHWLNTYSGLHECSIDDLKIRLATYPNETPSAWLEKAFARYRELHGARDRIAIDLKRWLPSSWRLSRADVDNMVQTAMDAIEQGVDMMQEIAVRYRGNNESPST